MSQINTKPTNDIICPAHNYKSLINKNSVTYKSLINESITGTPLPLPFMYTGTFSVDLRHGELARLLLISD